MTDEPRTKRQDDPDCDLIRAIAAGDVRALDALYARHGPGILSFLIARLNDRELAEEVLQDVMLAVWRNAANFRGESKVLTWMLTIARNRAINTQRRRQPKLVMFSEELGLPGNDTGPLDKVEKRDRNEAVRDALDMLPDAQREVLVLVFYHHLSGVEVAELLGISVGTVKSRLFRAKEMLRRVLQGEGSL